METSSVTSKTSLIKALLLKSWRERWTDIQWGIHIKTILPRGVSGDVYNLADIILQQALVGYWPNEQLLSYLKHSLSSQLISYAAVLTKISKFVNLERKAYCVVWLLNFVDSILGRITCRSKPEESVLPSAVLTLVYWLLYIYYNSLKNDLELKELTQKPIIILNRLLKNRFTLSLIYLAKHEERDLYGEILKKCKEIEKLFETKSPPEIESINIQSVLQSWSNLDSFVRMELPSNRNSIDYSIQAILMIVVLRSPTTSTQIFVNHLLTIQQLKGYSNSKLYMELIRACFFNMNDAIEENEDSQWGAFIFIKVPHIIQQMAFHYYGSSYDGALPEQASQEIVKGFLLLMEFNPLLHTIDLHTSCSNVEILLNEMVNIHIISEADKTTILNRRRNGYGKVTALNGISPHPNKSIPTVIINEAKPTLSRILKILETEYSNIQRPLLSALCQFFNGHNFDVILAVASVKGELHKFVNGLIRFNEYSKQIDVSDSKSAYTKSLVFDVTFLMLCSITQKYGSEVVFTNGYGDTFFEKWVRDCMIEEDKNKAAQSLMKHTDEEKIKILMAWFDSPEWNVTNVPMNWDEVCMAMPIIMKEIHDGWRNSTFTNSDVKRKIDIIRSQMRSLAVCSVSWLCSYMQVLPEDELLKPRNMVHKFFNPLTFDELNQNQDETQQENNYFEGRCWFAFKIMYHMQYGVNPPMMPPKSQSYIRSLVSKDSIFKQLLNTWEELLDQSWLSFKQARSVETIFLTSDHSSFIKFMLQEVMKQRYEDELNKSTDLLLGLFYFDLEGCTLALINQIPHLLFKPAANNDLVEPQSIAVAKLISYSIFTSARCYGYYSGRIDTKSLDLEQDIEDLCPASKIMRLSGPEDGNTPMVYVSTGGGKSPHPMINQKLADALDNMFYTFNVVANRNASTTFQDIFFVIRVLEQIVICGKEGANSVLSHLPNTLVPNLIRSIPNELSMELILHLYNLNTPAGRKSAVRDLCLLKNLKTEVTDV